MSATEDLLTLGAVAGVGLALGACSSGGGGGGDDPEPELGAVPELTVDRITIAVQVDDNAAVTIGTLPVSADGSGGHSAIAALDGNAFAADPGIEGSETTYAWPVSAGSESVLVECLLNTSRRRLVDGCDNFPLKHHLLERTGFGVHPEDIARFAAVSYEGMVEQLVEEIRDTAFLDPPAFLEEPVLSYAERRDLSDEERRDYNDRVNQWRRELQTWWLREMYHSPDPLSERMVLFWHGLWTSSLQSCPVSHLMWYQQATMRQYGVRNFAAMAHLISKDAAMVRYLDSDSNVKESPNENFARELMELFSLGEGMDYEEADIPEIARCFTGYNLDEHWQFAFLPERHDYGDKHYFESDHQFDSTDESSDGFTYIEGDYVIDQILAKDRCAIYICERLWDEFIGTARDETLIAEWAGLFRAAYDLRPALKALFLSEAFRNTRGSRIKSPVELVLGTYRRLGLVPEDGFDDLIGPISGMGQTLFYPPSVRGWPHNQDWITAEHYLVRRQSLGNLGWSLRDRLEEHHAEALTDLMLTSEPIGLIRTDHPANTLQDLLRDPAYNLS